MSRSLTIRAAACVAALFAIFAALGPSARAQQPQASVTINQVDDTHYPDLRAIVAVLDASNVPVPNLGQAQFQAFDGDKPLPISGVQTAQDASLKLSVVIVIDISGSMLGTPLDSAKLAATQFVQNIGPKDEAAVVAFSDTVTPVVPFTADRAKLTNAIASLQAAGGTALYDAVQTSAYVARASGSARSAVVLLTDGENDAKDSPSTADGSTAAAKGAGVPVFTVGFGVSPDVGYLQGLSASTQGQYAPATAENVGSVYTRLAGLLRNQYVVTTKAQAPADGKPATFRIVAAVGSASVAGISSFTRGSAPAIAPAIATAQSAGDAAPVKKATGSSSTPLIVFSAVVAVVVLAVLVYIALRWRRRRQIMQHQLQVIEPNPRQAAAQPLPQQSGEARVTAIEAGTGRLVEKSSNGSGRIWELYAGPAVIGSSPRVSTILLPETSDVAPEHVRIWLRGGRYVLHHAAGPSRKTLVGGREADWVTLEPGDEVQVGRYKFTFDDPAATNGTH